MNKIKTLKCVVLVCAGITFWVPPCYSFGFPTFDIAEVGATIKGIVTDVQSYVSTVQSTITESKLLQSLGDSVSALTKFRDEASEKLREAEKAARKLKSSERLAKLREKLEAEKDLEEEIDSSEDAAADVPEIDDFGNEDWGEGAWGNEGNNGGSDEPKTFTPNNQDLVDEPINSGSQEDEDLWGDEDDLELPKKHELPVVSELPLIGSGDDGLGEDLWGEDSVEDERSVTDGPLLIDSELMPALDKALPERPVIVDGKDFPKLDEGAALVTPVKAVSPASTGTNAPATGPVVNKPVLNTAPVQRTPFLKQSMLIEYDLLSSKSSYASMGVKTGTNEDGRFLFSDIIAQKCNMDYKDAQNEDKVKECFKKWVICLSGCKENDLNTCNAADAQRCMKEYKQAMQDQVAADLAASLNDKEYSASFDSDVADDLSNKSQALSTERDEVSYSGEVSRASQEILNRLLYSMSSEVLQNSFMAIEQIKKDYYNDESL